MKYLKTKSNYTYTTIKGEDPHSEPITYIPEGYPVTFTGIVSPDGTPGTYAWHANPSGKVEISGDTTGEITQEDPITPTIGVTGLEPTENLTLTFVFTSTHGTVISGTHTTSVITTTITVITSTMTGLGLQPNVGLGVVKNGDIVTYTISADLGMTVTATAAISTTPNTPNYMNQWELGYIQNVISTTLIITYTNTVRIEKLSTLPALDSGEGLDPITNTATFNATNGYSATVSREDNPKLYVPWDDSRTNEKNTLEEYHSDMKLVTWLVARNKATKQIVYLKYWHWVLAYHIKYDTSLPPEKRTEVLGEKREFTIDPPPEGKNGQGPYNPKLDGIRANKQERIITMTERKK